MRNRYHLLYAQAAFEAVRTYKPHLSFFVRSGSPVAQAYQHLRWPGDPHVSWGLTSGFQSMLPAALSAGLSGLLLAPRDRRRHWLACQPRPSASCAALAAASTSAACCATPTATTDLSTAELERRRDHRGLSTYARLHSSLVPYLYSYARIASEISLPLMRHLAPTGRIQGPGARSGSTPWATTCW